MTREKNCSPKARHHSRHKQSSFLMPFQTPLGSVAAAQTQDSCWGTWGQCSVDSAPIYSTSAWTSMNRATPMQRWEEADRKASGPFGILSRDNSNRVCDCGLMSDLPSKNENINLGCVYMFVKNTFFFSFLTLCQHSLAKGHWEHSSCKLGLLVVTARARTHSGETKGHLSKRALERNCYRIWVLIGWFRGGSGEVGVHSRLAAVRKQG